MDKISDGLNSSSRQTETEHLQWKESVVLDTDLPEDDDLYLKNGWQDAGQDSHLHHPDSSDFDDTAIEDNDSILHSRDSANSTDFVKDDNSEISQNTIRDDDSYSHDSDNSTDSRMESESVKENIKDDNGEVRVLLDKYLINPSLKSKKKDEWEHNQVRGQDKQLKPDISDKTTFTDRKPVEPEEFNNELRSDMTIE
jgi:hypothetical protein